MPNWCTNILTVTGDSGTLFTFLMENKASEEQMLSFAKVLPVTEETVAEAIKDCKDWGAGKKLLETLGNQTMLWGTKWDAHIISIETARVTEGSLTYHFDTAWSPPARWFEKVVKPYTNLKFTLLYGEPGMWFSGEYKAENGEVVSKDEGDYRKYFPCCYCGDMDCDGECEKEDS